MLKRVGETPPLPSVPIAEAGFPAPFASGLEYSVPARGGWTIVHVGMLIPEAHEIFVCASACLRGVVLSAAEMDLMDRFSTVSIEEHNVLEGDMEALIVEGVADILQRLPKLPPAVLVYSSCIHHFVGCDLALCYDMLRKRFPGVDFTDCYMTPTMRKSGLTPDQIMRRQLYSLLRPLPKDPRACAVIGNCFSLDESSDLVRMIRSAGFTLYQLPDMKTYAEYLETAKSSFCISTQSVARAGGDALEQRLGVRHLYLPVSYSSEEIRRNKAELARALGIDPPEDAGEEAAVAAALDRARETLGDTPVVIDYTFTPRPLGLARLLWEHRFRVTRLYLDSFSPEEREDLAWLREHAPAIEVCPTVSPVMRKARRGSPEKVLAIGQKAAYLSDTGYFVDLVENGGLYGFDGMRKLADLIEDAYLHEKDTETLIQRKGWGCESCI